MINQDIFEYRGALLIRDVLVSGKKGDIFIDETGTITGAGEGIGRLYHGDAEFVIDGKDRIAIPSRVNTHTHAAMTLLRGYADDMILQDWLNQKIWPLEAHLSGEDVYWGTRLACLEMIRSGTTAFNDMYFFMEDAARAVDESGIRAVLSHGFIDLGMQEKRETECRATEKLVSHIRAMNNDRIRAAVGPHAIYTVSPEGLDWCAEYARQEKIGIHIHLSETEKEVTDCLAQYGKRPAQHLDDHRILAPGTVLAHCCWLDEAECSLIGKRNASVSHNPASNMKLATNRAMPYPWLKRESVQVSLGTDGCASNNSLDMFEAAKTAALLQKFYWNDPTVLPAGEAQALAGTCGARALGLGPGTIEQGTPADIILVAKSVPCNIPLHTPDSNLTYACTGSSVMTTICHGRVLMHDRQVPGEEEVLRQAAAAAHALVSRTAS